MRARYLLTDPENLSHCSELLGGSKEPKLWRSLNPLKRRKDHIHTFAPTGIYPLNPEKVLKKLPDYKEAADYGDYQAKLDYLKELRLPANKP
ncbi:unnamed protein product [Parnassius apollo]|uniref:(apollo) hypothetical protein n=1 Tax=Parnassius apollo TaxID=110799 RepID=A0A8S3WQH6_PARAO|nr:unnamed protein product [Parnassius apollo]